MAIFMMGGGQTTQIREHRGSVAEKPTCYRGTYQGVEHDDMPPRAKFAEAEDDMVRFCTARRDEQGGMVSYSLPIRSPKKVLAGTDDEAA